MRPNRSLAALPLCTNAMHQPLSLTVVKRYVKNSTLFLHAKWVLLPSTRSLISQTIPGEKVLPWWTDDLPLICSLLLVVDDQITTFWGLVEDVLSLGL